MILVGIVTERRFQCMVHGIKLYFIKDYVNTVLILAASIHRHHQRMVCLTNLQRAELVF